MNEGEETRQSFSWVRRWGAGLNLIISVAAVAALVAMFNYLAIRHFTRFHWNRTAEADLSERTQQVLKSLTNIVKVTIYWNSTEDMLLPRVKGLLKEYQFASPRIQVQYVDYTRDVAAAEKVKQDYKLPPGKKDAIIFEANGGSAVVNASDLSDYDYSELLSGKSKEIYRTHFKGELMFTSKIYSVATGRRTVAYYLHENGEHADVGDPSLDGYGKFFAMLRNENNFDVRPLRIVGTNEIPTDCQLLIIAGPITPLAASELDRIQAYLVQGGRALIAFNRYTATSRQQAGLEKLLAKWGVEVGENTVIDKENSLSGGPYSGYVWTTEEIETLAAFTKWKGLEGMRGGAAKRLGEAMEKLKGFPLRTKIDMKTGGNPISLSNEVLEVKDGAPPKDVLTVPAGYAKTTPRAMAPPPPPPAR